MKISEKAYRRLASAVSVVALLLCIAICFCLFTFAYVPSGSMIPTLKINDVCVFRKTKNVERGDIVLFYPFAGDKNEKYVKRAIAFEGDTVAIKGGRLYLNGELQDESYLNEEFMEGDMLEYVVPEGCFFAMGDNRNHSSDSRYFGAFPCDRLIGELLIHF